MAHLVALWQTLISTLYDVIPIIAILMFFQFGILRKPIPNVRRVVIGFIYVLIGLTLFLAGLNEALLPLGKLMATQLTDPAFLGLEQTSDVNWKDYYWVYAFAFFVGLSTTFAEPSLLAVAIKAEEVFGGAIDATKLRMAVAVGVGTGITLGCYRIIVGDPLHYYIIVAYIFVILQTQFAPKMIIPLAYDSGGVTTSTVTVPLVAALGIGLASTIEGRSVLIDGFGLIAFACLFPIMTVMGYAQLSQYLLHRKTKIAEE